jgi:hypothetical protein
MSAAGERGVYDLFVLNIALQIFDGVATYQGLRVGWREANPILVAAFAHFGIGPTLLLFKANACGLLFLLNRYRAHAMVGPALALLATLHVLLSLLPWSYKFLTLGLRFL